MKGWAAHPARRQPDVCGYEVVAAWKYAVLALDAGIEVRKRSGLKRAKKLEVWLDVVAVARLVAALPLELRLLVLAAGKTRGELRDLDAALADVPADVAQAIADTEAQPTLFAAAADTAESVAEKAKAARYVADRFRALSDEVER